MIGRTASQGASGSRLGREGLGTGCGREVGGATAGRVGGARGGATSGFTEAAGAGAWGGVGVPARAVSLAVDSGADAGVGAMALVTLAAAGAGAMERGTPRSAKSAMVPSATDVARPDPTATTIPRRCRRAFVSASAAAVAQARRAASPAP